MNTVIEQMLRKYDSKNIYDQKNAMKEVMQEIVLYGLSRAGFFREAAFYGGTALRIFYGLDRFSEDLDFSLMTSNPNFDLKAYFPELEKTVRSFGLNVVISEKEKNKESAIRSAFLKGNTKEHFLLFYADEVTANSITKNEALKIKFEIDTMPPAFATFERRFCLAPMPYEINLYDEPYWAVQENINAIRAAAGLSPLAMDGGLSAAADARCESFVAGGAFDHSGMTTRSEICAAGPIGSASSVCSYWQNSPAHYANITNASFTSMGVACWFCSTAEGQYTYWTVTFN